jgi:hypothetical protein
MQFNIIQIKSQQLIIFSLPNIYHTLLWLTLYLPDSPAFL